MNKKFSTLMASLLLASAFTANAEETAAQKWMNVTVDQLISGRTYQIWTANGDSVLTIGRTGNTETKYQGPLFVKAESATPGTLVVTKSNGALTFADPSTKIPVYPWVAAEGDSCLYSHSGGKTAIALTPNEAEKGYKLTAKVGDATLDVNSWGAAWTLKVTQTVNSGASEEIKAQTYIFKALDENGAVIPEDAKKAVLTTKQNVYLVVDGKYIGVKPTAMKATIDGEALVENGSEPTTDIESYLWIKEGNGLKSVKNGKFLNVSESKLTLGETSQSVNLENTVLSVNSTVVGYASVLTSNVAQTYQGVEGVKMPEKIYEWSNYVLMAEGEAINAEGELATYQPGEGSQLWNVRVAEGQNSTYLYFVNVKTGEELRIDDKLVSAEATVNDDGTVAITGIANGVFTLNANSKYVAAENGSLSASADVLGQAISFGLGIAQEDALKAKELNYFEADGFSVSIKGLDADYNYTVALKDDYFSGKHLTPRVYNNDGTFSAASNEDKFYLYDAQAEKYVVVVNNLAEGDGDKALGFAQVTEEALRRDIKKTGEQNYSGRFSFLYNQAVSGTTKLTKISTIKVYKNSQDTEVGTVGRLDLRNNEYYLAVQPAGEATINLKPIEIKLGSGQEADAKKVLKATFFTVEQVKSNGTHLNWLTATDFNNAAFNNSARNILEKQWSLDYAAGVYTFANRENPNNKFELNGNGSGDPYVMYVIDYDKGSFRVGNNYYVIKPVEVAPADGYKRLGDVKNQKFNIGYWSTAFGANAWLNEKHSGSDAHVLGMSIDKEQALTWTATAYNAQAKQWEDKYDSYKDKHYATDSIYVVSTLKFWNPNRWGAGVAGWDDRTKDTLKVVSYSFVNQYNEPLVYDNENGCYVVVPKTANNYATVTPQKFVIREADDHSQLRAVDFKSKDQKDGLLWKDAAHAEHQEFGTNDKEKMYAGDTQNGKLIRRDLWNSNENDLFDVVSTDVPMYRRIVNDMDTISIFRDANDQSLLFEDGKFLGMENAKQFDFNPAFLADTAYVRYETYRPTYLLAVGAKVTPAGKYCPVHGADADCKDEHLKDVAGWVDARYLVNLKDTAIAWDAANKHKDGNPYINSEKCYRLGFVQARHINDTLAIAATKPTAKDSIYVGDGALTAATFAFRYVDQSAKSFVIETANFEKLDQGDNAGKQTSCDGYVKWMNGVVVVVPTITDADVFNMTEGFEGEPTANDAISAEAGVQVISGKGAITVQGAAGKVITVADILGRTIANQVAASNNVTIAAPAGIAVVTVNGEATKVVVK